MRIVYILSKSLNHQIRDQDIVRLVYSNVRMSCKLTKLMILNK